jgi:Tfp pilus assembly protein PilX
MQRVNARKYIKNDKGFLLIAALTLLTALTVLGTTAYLLSSTDIKIGGNFRNGEMVLQAAMAGAERGRETLRLLNLSSTNKYSFSDELLSRVGPNAILNGYSATTDDVALASGTFGSAYSSVSYVAYLTNDAGEGLGVSSVVDTNNKVLITSVATGPSSSKAKVAMVVTWYPPPPSPAMIYSKDDITLNGSSLVISGIDACGGGTNLAPIYTMDPATTTTHGLPTLLGNPATPTHGPLDIDLQEYIDAFMPATVTLTTDPPSGGTYGSPSNYVTVYADAQATQADHELRLNNVTGYGILLVKGDLQTAGNFNWNGLIIVTGNVSSTGGAGSVKNIQGQILMGGSSLGDTTISGSVAIGYDSCKVRQALSAKPLKIVNWKHYY